MSLAPLQFTRYSALLMGMIYGKKRYGECRPGGSAATSGSSLLPCLLPAPQGHLEAAARPPFPPSPMQRRAVRVRVAAPLLAALFWVFIPV